MWPHQRFNLYTGFWVALAGFDISLVAFGVTPVRSETSNIVSWVTQAESFTSPVGPC